MKVYILVAYSEDYSLVLGVFSYRIDALKVLIKERDEYSGYGTEYKIVPYKVIEGSK